VPIEDDDKLREMAAVVTVHALKLQLTSSCLASRDCAKHSLRTLGAVKHGCKLVGNLRVEKGSSDTFQVTFPWRPRPRTRFLPSSSHPTPIPPSLQRRRGTSTSISTNTLQTRTGLVNVNCWPNSSIAHPSLTYALAQVTNHSTRLDSTGMYGSKFSFRSN
jgi:hypothetical protein